MNDNHLEFMGRALDLAREALRQDEFPVGCVLVHGNTIIADGRRRGTRRKTPSELEHAEIIALGKLESLPSVAPRNEITLYCTLEPCLMCYGAILLCGIGRLIYAYEDAMGGAAMHYRDTLKPLYAENPMEIKAGVCRPESLALFKAFFNNPKIDYWRDSLLAQYTLAQK